MFNTDEKIVIVDSDSDDKQYFEEVKKYSIPKVSNKRKLEDIIADKQTSRSQADG
jgi:hypothetical protein